MKLSTPRWWYVRSRAPMPVTRMLLRPISWIWAWVTARRIRRAAPQSCGAAVICVGNVTMGGAGKTPVVRALTSRLRAQGREAAILSRGYGGRLKGPVRVDPSRHQASDVGDEPLMLASSAPVWISANRLAGAHAAAAAGAKVIVMDDGHQNPSLARQLSLIVVDGETRNDEWPFGDGAVFPAGPMREPLSAGLARADGVILLMPADLATPDPELVALFGDLPVLTARLAPVGQAPDGPVVAFAGVGKPWKVERGLLAAGVRLADFAAFPDHFGYDEATLERLAERARDFGASLLTTEKDWARLPAAWRSRVLSWPVEVSFDDADRLDRLVLDHIGAGPQTTPGRDRAEP